MPLGLLPNIFNRPRRPLRPSPKEYFVSFALVDLGFGSWTFGPFGDLVRAKAAAVSEELFLDVFCDPLLDEDEFGVKLMERRRVSTGGSNRGTVT